MVLFSVSSDCKYFYWLVSAWTKWPPFWQTTFWNAFSWMKMIELCLKIHWNLLPGVQLTINQHWLRQRLCTEQSTSHYLSQCLPSSLTRICGTRGRWVKALLDRTSGLAWYQKFGDYGTERHLGLEWATHVGWNIIIFFVFLLSPILSGSVGMCIN